MNAQTSKVNTRITVINADGQITLGKEHAGSRVLAEESEPGVWLVRTAIAIPVNERWLHEPQAAASLQATLVWAAKHKPQATSLDTLFKGMTDGNPPDKSERNRTLDTLDLDDLLVRVTAKNMPDAVDVGWGKPAGTEAW